MALLRRTFSTKKLLGSWPTTALQMYALKVKALSSRQWHCSQILWNWCSYYIRSLIISMSYLLYVFVYDTYYDTWSVWCVHFHVAHMCRFDSLMTRDIIRYIINCRLGMLFCFTIVMLDVCLHVCYFLCVPVCLHACTAVCTCIYCVVWSIDSPVKG